MLILLVFLLAAATFFDWKEGRIPNLLILFGSIAGIVMGQSPGERMLWALLVIILFIPFYLIRALGAGDIKCIAFVSMYLTMEQLLSAVFYTFLTAAVMSVLKIIWFRFRKKETVSLRCLTIHLAFPILLGVLISTGGDLLCIIS